ncbi:MAG: hypothetical protein AAF483_04575 [Planctomycetota bacterium]
MNFFSWLRDGVRQSVLLGVSDAVEQLGSPSEEELHPSVSGFLKTDGATAAPALTSTSTKTGRGGRKRLGKSLKDIEAEKKK